MTAVNDFEVFGLERKLGIDTDALQRAYYELARRYHPDFQQGASPEAQAEALEASARLNAAYRTLRDPLARIEYLVRLEEGRETREGAEARAAAPPALLAEMFEIQEALADARAGGALDEATRQELGTQREHLVQRCRGEEARLVGPLAAAWDAGAGRPAERARVLAEFKQALATRAYLKTVIEDLGQLLGEGEASVAHHRH
jgi:molecular chaperone HscB